MIQLFKFFGAPCPGGDFFGLPKWHKYLDGQTQYIGPNGNVLDPAKDSLAGASQQCIPKLSALSDIWLVAAAVIEMLLRVAAVAALVFVVYGGIQYIMSQGEPDHTAKARSTVVNALIGLVLSIGAATFVSFIAGRFQ